MRLLNVAIIGAGMAFEKLHYPAYEQLKDKYRIVALCDIDRKKTQKWVPRLGLGEENIYTDFREMLSRDDIDLFDIMVPISQNYKVTAEIAQKISGSNKGIICEKPAAGNLEDAQKHRRLPTKYKIPILIAENYRYNEETNLIRKIIQEKKVGEVVYFLYNRAVDFPKEMVQNKFPAKQWRQYPDFPGGALLDIGIHDIAALRHIFGAVENLQAFGRPQKADFSPYAAVNVNILFKNGITGHFSFYCAGKEAQSPLIGMRIIGTEGMIYLEEKNCGIINIFYNNGEQEQIPYTPQKGYYNELMNYYNAYFNKEPIFVTPEVEYGDIKMIMDILKSIRNKEVVEVDKEEEEEEERIKEEIKII